MDGERLAAMGTVLSAGSRADILCALMSGTAHTSSELASHVRVAPSTASEHLGVLLDAGLVVARAQGRHRYFALAGPEVADLLERVVAAVPPAGSVATPAVPAPLAYARSCYDHLAGELGVRLHDRLVDRGHLVDVDGHAAVTESGRAWLGDLGLEPTTSARRPDARACLDWSERRSHLGGAAGTALLGLMLGERWLVRHRNHPRALVPTAAGRRAFATHLDLEVR